MSASVYVAGKISGDKDYKEKFKKAEELLSSQGFTVLNPAWMPEGLTNGEYIRMSLAMLDCA